MKIFILLHNLAKNKVLKLKMVLKVQDKRILRSSMGHYYSVPPLFDRYIRNIVLVPNM